MRRFEIIIVDDTGKVNKNILKEVIYGEYIGDFLIQTVNGVSKSRKNMYIVLFFF